MKLIIDKKYLIRVERYTKFGYGGTFNLFASRYVFRLPKSAGLPEGYTVYIDADVRFACDERNNFIADKNGELIISEYLELKNGSFYIKPSCNGYLVLMTENREPGKHYKRYNYSAEELYALYQNVDLSNATHVIARIINYIDGKSGNLHQAIYGNRIDYTDYYIGKIQGNWFYCDELNTKRRIKSNGVKILGEIDVASESEIRKLICSMHASLAKHERNYKNLFDVKDSIKNLVWDLSSLDSYHPVADDDVNKVIKAIQDSAAAANQLIELKLNNKELEQGVCSIGIV